MQRATVTNQFWGRGAGWKPRWKPTAKLFLTQDRGRGRAFPEVGKDGYHLGANDLSRPRLARLEVLPDSSAVPIRGSQGHVAARARDCARHRSKNQAEPSLGRLGKTRQPPLGPRRPRPGFALSC